MRNLDNHWNGFVGKAADEAEAAFKKLGWENDPRHPLLPCGDHVPGNCLDERLLREFSEELVALRPPPYILTVAIDSGNGACSYGAWCLKSEARSLLMEWVDVVAPPVSSETGAGTFLLCQVGTTSAQEDWAEVLELNRLPDNRFNSNAEGFGINFLGTFRSREEAVERAYALKLSVK